MKIRLELNIPAPGVRFLNYWDSLHGNDTCCEIVDGKLMLMQYDEDANELPSKEISLMEFIESVEKAENE